MAEGRQQEFHLGDKVTVTYKGEKYQGEIMAIQAKLHQPGEQRFVVKVAEDKFWRVSRSRLTKAIMAESA